MSVTATTTVGTGFVVRGLVHEAIVSRGTAHAKHGTNSIEMLLADSPRWLPVLVEEVGEVANTLTYDGPGDRTRAELIDVLAVVTAWLDAIDNHNVITGRNLS